MASRKDNARKRAALGNLPRVVLPAGQKPDVRECHFAALLAKLPPGFEQEQFREIGYNLGLLRDCRVPNKVTSIDGERVFDLRQLPRFRAARSPLE